MLYKNCILLKRRNELVLHMNSPLRITSQAAGAYGEKAVEAELLRRGWIPSNVNSTVKNSVDFDIFALKDQRSVQIRVKTCSPGQDAFQFSFSENRPILTEFGPFDFSVLVRMGLDRTEDCFYVMPTLVLRKRIHDYSIEYLATRKRNGGERRNTGHWTLWLGDLRNGEARMNYGLATHWATYLNNWYILETQN